MVVVDGSVKEAVKVSLRDRVQQRFEEQITLTLQVPQGCGSVGGLQGFLPSSSGASSSHSPDAVDETSTGLFFRTFSQNQKSPVLGPHSGLELGADFNPWTPVACAGSMVLEEGELGIESEPEEDVVVRFADGFRLLWVCMRFLELHMGRPVRECAYGDRCTFALSWAELHPEASAHEYELASYLPE